MNKSKIIPFLIIPFISLIFFAFTKASIIEVDESNNNTFIEIKKSDIIKIKLSGEKYLSGHQWIQCPTFMPKYSYTGPRFIDEVNKTGDYSSVVFEYSFNEVGPMDICLQNKRSWEDSALQTFNIKIFVK